MEMHAKHMSYHKQKKKMKNTKKNTARVSQVTGKRRDGQSTLPYGFIDAKCCHKNITNCQSLAINSLITGGGVPYKKPVPQEVLNNIIWTYFSFSSPISGCKND